MKKKYDIALFDLDGTLSESGEGILECVRSIFDEMNRPLPDEKIIASFIGPPIYESLKRCDFCHEDAEKGVEIYRKNFVKSGIYKNRVYQGIFEVLEALKNSGVKLGVASTKYQKFTDEIIEMLGLKQYFSVVAGSNSLRGEMPENEKIRHNKIEVMHYVIDTLKGSDSERIVMIGDTKFDAEGAAKIGCDFIGCLYGYGTKEEMTAYFPDGIYIHKPEEIFSVMIQ